MSIKSFSHRGAIAVIRAGAIILVMAAGILLAGCAGLKSSTAVVSQGSAHEAGKRRKRDPNGLARNGGGLNGRRPMGVGSTRASAQKRAAYIRTGSMSNVTVTFYDGEPYAHRYRG